MWATQLAGLSQVLVKPVIQPFSMKSEVIKPQAMKAPMLGMTMLDRNVPNFCTRTRIDEGGASTTVVISFLPSGPPQWHGACPDLARSVSAFIFACS